MSDRKKRRAHIGLFVLVALAILIHVIPTPSLGRSAKRSDAKASQVKPRDQTSPRGNEQPAVLPADLSEASADRDGKGKVQLVSSVQTVVNRAVAAAPPPPTQESLSRIQQSLEKLDKLVPKLESALEEFRLLARDTRAAIPDLRDTNTAVQKLIKDVDAAVPDARTLIKGATDTLQEVKGLAKSVNEAMPDARKLIKEANETMPIARDTLTEIKLAAKNWKSVGERTDKLLESNEQRINNIIQGTEKAVASADQAIKSTDKAMTNVSETFNVENRNNVTTILRNLNRTLEKGPGIADETELFLRQGRGTLKRADETFDTLNRATKPGSSETAGILKNLSEGLERFNKTMGDVNDLFRVIDRSDGTLRRFIADPGLYNHIDDAAGMMTRLLPRVDRALKDFEVFADKLARHPEALGLGGVVRPNSGLKEPPRSQYPHGP